ncbi:hypothetical protein K0M31_012562 [Melipona bicolor]|uniref:Uncharacterized protein n=1 Tax=Melipona bicolor TaxID=60889 RepID=A0AA40FJT0_9HYME|nr:hypothetical protein K0M31_012562 [Melipona bicolor]
MGISCIFLFLTLIVYICLPVLQNLHGKTLMCHVSSLLTAFLCHTVIHWLSNDKLREDVTLCYILENSEESESLMVQGLVNKKDVVMHPILAAKIPDKSPMTYEVYHDEK